VKSVDEEGGGGGNEDEAKSVSCCLRLRLRLRQGVCPLPVFSRELKDERHDEMI
jgi:hypothetical protein